MNNTLAVAEALFQLDWTRFLAGLSAIGIAFFVNAIGCLLIWRALQ